MPTATVHETIVGLTAAHPTPCEILWDLLDRWMMLDETRATWEEVEDLYHDIMGFWRAYPAEAEGWYAAWREIRDVTHP